MLEPYLIQRLKSLQKKTPPHDLHWFANAATHMCWKTHPKQPSAQGAHTTVNEARYADWRVFEKGWLPSTVPKSHLQMYLVAETNETRVKNVAMSRKNGDPIFLQPDTRRFHQFSKCWEPLGVKISNLWTLSDGSPRFCFTCWERRNNYKMTREHDTKRTKIHSPVAKSSPKKACQKKHHSMWPPAGTKRWLRPVDREISRAYRA